LRALEYSVRAFSPAGEFLAEKRIATDRIDMPIIFITGHGGVPMAMRAMEGGAVLFFAKPYGDESGGVEMPAAAKMSDPHCPVWGIKKARVGGHNSDRPGCASQEFEHEQDSSRGYGARLRPGGRLEYLRSSYNLRARISQQELLMNGPLQLCQKECCYVSPSKPRDRI
jgi:hypothetical protein